MIGLSDNGDLRMKRIQIGDVELDLFLDPHRDRFYLKIPGDDEVVAVGASVNEVRQEAAKGIAKNKVRVEIPFITKRGVRGIATGFHSRTKEVLVKVETPEGEHKTDQWSKYHWDVFDESTPVSKIDEWVRLNHERGEITDKITDIEREFIIDLSVKVREAINQKVEEKFSNV